MLARHLAETVLVMIFYYSPGACSLAAHIALHQAGAKFESRKVNLYRGEQTTAEYLAVNAKGRVPALVTEQGILTENSAILAFISQLFPEADLAPINDPFAFAQVQEFNCYLASTVHVAHAHGPRGYRWADTPAALVAMKEKVPQTMTAAFRLIEDELLTGPWVMGEKYSICDIYLYTLSRWLEDDGVDTTLLPRVIEHRNRMQALAQVAEVLQLEGLA
ncbi:MAG: glutathione S-transferase [Gammaproteobacteria bacterium]|jgi:glutathione S-transferase|nr:glutathione S-transferase [Gammaproteobacteria bacterium]MBT5201967.1 glutathione S-transferase [Gammaproteobacteria bacterium]MBT5603112.1 glutathione S-transferase [Gammaproteobacteria bacterium]MBT6246345.1 glutathione S-transferase [Gammaproteobacteria bacterium]